MTDDTARHAENTDESAWNSRGPSGNPLSTTEGLAQPFFVVLFVLSTAGLLYVLADFLPDIVFAFILVGLFSRFYRRLSALLGGRPWLASALVTCLVVGAIVVPLGSLGYTIVKDATVAYERVVAAFSGSGPLSASSEPVRELRAALTRAGLELSADELKTHAVNAANGARTSLIAFGGALLSNTVAALVHFSIVLVLVFYLLVDGERLREFMFELSPLPDDEDALLVETFTKVARGVVIGNGAGSLLQGILAGGAMWMAGFNSPVLWGSIMSFFAFLPLVGISIVVIPAATYLAISGRPWAALVFFVFCTIQGLVVENVVKTKLIGSQMRMHDLLVFLAILGGIATFGVVGLVYGPLIAMLFMTLTDLYRRRYRPELALRLARVPSVSASPAQPLAAPTPPVTDESR